MSKQCCAFSPYSGDGERYKELARLLPGEAHFERALRLLFLKCLAVITHRQNQTGHWVRVHNEWCENYHCEVDAWWHIKKDKANE